MPKLQNLLNDLSNLEQLLVAVIVAVSGLLQFLPVGNVQHVAALLVAGASVVALVLYKVLTDRGVKATPVPVSAVNPTETQVATDVAKTVSDVTKG